MSVIRTARDAILPRAPKTLWRDLPCIAWHPKSIKCKEASSSDYSHVESDVLNTGPWSHPGNNEPNQLAKPSFLFAAVANTISVEWALTNVLLLLKGLNSSLLCSSWSSLVPLYFSVPDGSHGRTSRLSSAPSHRDLHHILGSGGTLSNVNISHAAKTNAASVEILKKAKS